MTDQRAESSPPPALSNARPSAPGARAPTFSVPGLLNSLPRLLLRKGGSFAQFLRSMLKPGAKPVPTSHTWPAPMPYPDVFLNPCGRGGWKRRLLCLAFACLSWLYLGKPAKCPPEIGVGVPLNRCQERAVKLLEQAVFGSDFPLSFDAAGLGRHAAKIESHSDVLSCSCLFVIHACWVFPCDAQLVFLQQCLLTSCEGGHHLAWRTLYQCEAFGGR